MGPPRQDRRGSSKADTGARRRRNDDAVERLTAWFEAHDDWARTLAASIAARLEAVEDRADLLDGQAGNDGGLIGMVGELRGELKAIRERQDRQAQATETARTEVRAALEEIKSVKTIAVNIDGNTTPPQRTLGEKFLDFALKILLPVLLVVVPAVTAIIVAYLQLRGQLVQLTTPSTP